MPAAVLAGGASRRMGTPKASLPYAGTSLLQYQTERLSRVFANVFVVAKEPPAVSAGSARVICDGVPDFAAIHGVARALEEAGDRVFVLAVDLPTLPESVIRAIAEAGLASPAPALVPEADGILQPLAAVWSREILPALRRRVAEGQLSLADLARSEGAEIFAEERWRELDPSGNSFANMNTLQDYLASRERA